MKAAEVTLVPWADKDLPLLEQLLGDQKNWRNGLVYEMGWHVLSAHQGRGIATKAGEAILGLARSDRRHQFMHAFPSISNPASNAICRKLGFELLEECEFEYPPGHPMTVNDWRLDLVSETQFL